MKWELCLVVLLSLSCICRSQEDVLELHDDIPNPGQSTSQDELDFDSLTDDQKKQLYEMQRVRSVGCILYSQIYFNANAGTIQEIFEAHDKKNNHLLLFDKIVGRLIVHCMENAKDEDIVTILNRAKEGKFTIDDLIQLNTIDISDLRIPSDESYVLSAQEQRAVESYKEYEKMAKEEKQKNSQKKDKTSSSDKKSSSSEKKTASKPWFDFNFDNRSLGIPLLILMIALFVYLIQYLSSSEKKEREAKEKELNKKKDKKKK